MADIWEHLSMTSKLRVPLFAFLLFLVVSLGDARLHRTRSVSPSTEETVETYDKYYNYVGLTSRLQFLAQKYPHIANLSSIGQSVKGRELWVMRITKDPNVDAPGKPKFKYVGNMHGDETVSRQVLVYLVEYLLTKYGEEPRISELVNNTDIYIMPSMNPDGFEKSREGDCRGTSGGRNNAKNMDLNRSFPDQFDGTSVSPDKIPEVMAVIRWIQEKKWVFLFSETHKHTVPSEPQHVKPSVQLFEVVLPRAQAGMASVNSTDLKRFVVNVYLPVEDLESDKPLCQWATQIFVSFIKTSGAAGATQNKVKTLSYWDAIMAWCVRLRFAYITPSSRAETIIGYVY